MHQIVVNNRDNNNDRIRITWLNKHCFCACNAYLLILEKWFPFQAERAYVLLLPSQSSYPA